MNLKEYFLKIQNLYANRHSRSISILLIVLFLLFLLIIPALIYEHSLKASLNSYKSKYKELSILSSEYKLLREKVSLVEAKASNLQTGGIVNVVNDIASSLGITSKIKSIKGISSRQLKENISEETADINIEKLTLNELINLFHKIETSSAMLSVKRTNIKKSFDKPELLDVTITVSLFNIQPEEVKQ